MTDTTPAEAPASAEATPARRAITFRLDTRTLVALGLAGAGFVAGSLMAGHPTASPAATAQTPAAPGLTAAPVELGTGLPTSPALPTVTTPMATTPLTPAAATIPVVPGLTPSPVPTPLDAQTGPAPVPTVTVTVTHVETMPNSGAPSPASSTDTCGPASPTANPDPQPSATVTANPTGGPTAAPRPTSTR